jgi:hypothetical protein
MRVLFDQGTPVPIRRALGNHTVKTARQQGWSTLVNGELLRAAEQADFDVFLTFQILLVWDLRVGCKVAIVILSRNKWSLVRLRLQQIADAVDAAKPGTCTVVEIPGR